MGTFALGNYRLSGSVATSDLKVRLSVILLVQHRAEPQRPSPLRRTLKGHLRFFVEVQPPCLGFGLERDRA